MASTATIVTCTAHASSIVDQDSFCGISTELVETIVRAVNAGKSLSKINKTAILACCTELTEAIKMLPTLRDPAHFNEGVVRELSFQISAGMDSICSVHNDTINEVHAENAQIKEKVDLICQQNERLEDLVQLSGNMLSAALKENQPPQEPTPLTLTALTDKLKSEIREIVRSEISSLSDELKIPQAIPAQNIPSGPTPLSYASVLSKKIPTPITKPAIIVTAFDVSKKPQEVVSEWKKAISFRRHKYAPTKIQPIPNGKLRVEFERPEQCEETLTRTLATETFTAEKAKRRPPLVILKGVPNEVTKEELLDVIHNQNDVKIGRLCFLLRNRNTALYNVVLEVTPDMRRTILAMGKLNVDHYRVHVEDFHRFVQCPNCLQYGHTVRNCHSDSAPCPYCARRGHDGRNCDALKELSLRNCYNCLKYNDKMKAHINTNHSATDRKNCPRIKSMIDRLMNQTDYGYP